MRGRRRIGTVVGALTLLAGVMVERIGTGPAAALPAAGESWGWGSGTAGELGPVHVDRTTPAQLPLGWSFTALASGAAHTLAIGADGELYGWGYNTSGEVGTDGPAEVTAPTHVPFPGGLRPVAIAAGDVTSAAITDDGGLWLWGFNGFGNFGLGSTSPRQPTPIRSPLPGGIGARQVVVTYGYTLVLAEDGRAYTAGRNGGYELGDGSNQQRLSFVPVGIPGDARLAAVSYGTALGIDGTVYTWGRNNSGQLGTGSTAGWTDVRVAALPAGVRATAVAADMLFDHRGAVGSDGIVYTWGGNTRGQLGDGTTADRWAPVPVPLPGGVHAVSLHSGLVFMGALGADGRLYLWGANGSGEVGDGTRATRLRPTTTALPSGRTVVAFSLGQSFSYALLSDGTTAPSPTVPPTIPPTVPPSPGNGLLSVRAPGFTAVTPRRLFDTRDAGGAPVLAGTDHVLDLEGTVPASATDVVVNVTVTDPTAPGYVTVYPCLAQRPTASNLNYVSGQTVPNLVTVSLGDDARLCLYTSAATHLIADLAGWYEAGAGSGLVSRPPQRLFDTRAVGPVPAGSVHELGLVGTVGDDADAVILNVTATEATGSGYVTVYPCAAGRPTASNLNVSIGQTVPNLVIVAVGRDRRVCFYASTGMHLLADLAGWYAPSSDVGYLGGVPERAFDTRLDGAPIEAGDGVRLRVGPGGAAVPDDVVAVVLNVTAVDPTGPGFVTVFPCGDGQPTTSNLNFVAGQIVPNLAVVRADVDDDVCFYAHATTHLVVDLAGFFTQRPVVGPAGAG